MGHRQECILCSCVYHMEDAYGKKAVRLTKDIVSVAAKALQHNLTALGPLVLPYSELLKYACSMVLRSLGLHRKAYTPDFRKAFQHFAFHAGKDILHMNGRGCTRSVIQKQVMHMQYLKILLPF